MGDGETDRNLARARNESRFTDGIRARNVFETLVRKFQVERGRSFMDSRRWLIIRALTWGILALLATITASLAILGDWLVSITIGIVSTPLEILSYCIYEKRADNVGKVCHQASI